MKKLTTIAAGLKRVRRKPELAACAMAALLFLAALHAPARAQNTYGGATVVHAGAIGLVPGQTVSVTVPNFYFQDGRVEFLKHSIKVYEIGSSGITENPTGGLIYSGESGGLNEYGHIFTLSYGDLPVQGEPRTGRKEVWIEVESISFSATETRAEDFSAVVLPPTFELIDDRSGKTVVFGLLLPTIMKLGSARPATSAVSIEGGTGCTDTVDVGLVCPLSVGAAAGQTVRVVFRSTNDIDPFPTPSRETEVIVAAGPSSGGHVKVFNAATGALLWSRELTDLTSGLHTIDINRDELTEAGSPGTGRIQLRIVLGGMKVSLTTFEVFDNESGKTTVSGPMKESMETMKKAWKDAS